MRYNPFSTNIQSVERDRSGNWFYELFNSAISSNNGFKSELEKLNTVLSNPAVLTVIKYQCDMFSLGNIKAIRNGKEVPNDQLVKLLRYPNPLQTERQFLWDYMFWNMLGTAYLYSNSKIIKDSTSLYWLNPAQLVWTDEILKKLDKFILSDKSLKELEKITINYKNLDGTTTPFTLSEIKPFFDLSNGLGNWYKGNSTLDALVKIIRNSDTALDSKYSNLDFAGKFIVSKQKGTGVGVNNLPMGEIEKDDAKNKLRGSESVHVLKSPIDISRFVDNIDKLKLDKAYNEDVFKISKLYGHPKAIIETLESTGVFGEEKKEAKADFIDEVCKAKGNDLMNGLESMFGYNDKNIELVLDYSHLSFMHVREKQKHEAISREMNNLNLALQMGAIDEEELKARVKILISDD